MYINIYLYRERERETKKMKIRARTNIRATAREGMGQIKEILINKQKGGRNVRERGGTERKREGEIER